jgi:hypothetical protein
MKNSTASSDGKAMLVRDGFTEICNKPSNGRQLGTQSSAGCKRVRG